MCPKVLKLSSDVSDVFPKVLMLSSEVSDYINCVSPCPAQMPKRVRSARGRMGDWKPAERARRARPRAARAKHSLAGAGRRAHQDRVLVFTSLYPTAVPDARRDAARTITTQETLTLNPNNKP
jgi:hypothetical protein